MTNQWVDKWAEDLEQLKLELPKRHKNLFFYQNKRTFYNKIKKLKGDLNNYDYYMMIARIAEIVSSFRDAHTMLIIPVTRFLPFEFYWFAEGIYIVNAFERYKECVNCKVTHINGISISDVIQRIASIVSHENDSFLKSQLPKYNSASDVLYSLEIIDDFAQVEITVEGFNKEIRNIVVGSERANKRQIEIINEDVDSKCNIPLYRKNCDKNFWSYFIESNNTLYFSYNSCSDMKGISVKSFCADLIDFINRKDVRKLVIDLRKNLGGNSTLLEPFIRDLRNCKKLNQESGIFVILGRDTFSSALLNAYSLKNKTAAVFIGEATGGKPNCYGEVQYFELKNSKLKIRYSTEYYKIIKDDKQLSFFPDISFEVTFEDYMSNKDPCMEYILNLGKG